ncbi:CGNR zinc finger domain-containing protein [Streptomyces sp. SAS_270]|uniref:CGNR zinc finger domain-containing protein n=1 Tax=Streptomyces sp. SAS_270 TaxID=3412748 RepID=UPI00403C4321
MPRESAAPPTATADPMLAFPFIGGRPCLDFIATLGRRYGTPVERLTDPDALARWIDEAGLSTASGTDDEPAGATARDLTQARTLREALHRLVRAAMDGVPPDPADAALVNEEACRPDLAPQLAESAKPRPPLRWKADHAAPAALATVARDAVLLVTGPLLTRVKKCENPACSLLFLDDSQARRRRWCSMDRCGNLAKVAGYRSRSRAASTE